MGSFVQWEKDPLYQLNIALNPIVPRVTFYLVAAKFCLDQKFELLDILHIAINTLQQVEKQLHSEFDIFLTPEESNAAAHLGESLTTLAQTLDRHISLEPSFTAPLCRSIKNEISPEIETTIDIFRNAFLSRIIARQAQATQSAKHARENLHTISKKIFYVSLNASIEASRAHENGPIFNIISREVRRLAKQVENSLRD